jgi:hypothetical protein
VDHAVTLVSCQSVTRCDEIPRHFYSLALVNHTLSLTRYGCANYKLFHKLFVIIFTCGLGCFLDYVFFVHYVSGSTDRKTRLSHQRF